MKPVYRQSETSVMQNSLVLSLEGVGKTASACGALTVIDPDIYPIFWVGSRTRWAVAVGAALSAIGFFGQSFLLSLVSVFGVVPMKQTTPYFFKETSESGPVANGNDVHEITPYGCLGGAGCDGPASPFLYNIGRV